MWVAHRGSLSYSACKESSHDHGQVELINNFSGSNLTTTIIAIELVWVRLLIYRRNLKRVLYTAKDVNWLYPNKQFGTLQLKYRGKKIGVHEIRGRNIWSKRRKVGRRVDANPEWGCQSWSTVVVQSPTYNAFPFPSPSHQSNPSLSLHLLLNKTPFLTCTKSIGAFKCVPPREGSWVGAYHPPLALPILHKMYPEKQ